MRNGSIVSCFVLWVSSLSAQEEPGRTPSIGEPAPGQRPRYELARSCKKLDESIAQMRAALDSLAEARQLAESAEQQGKSVEAEKLVTLAAALQSQIAECEQRLRGGLGAVDAAKAAAEEEAPRSLLVSAVQEWRDRIVACGAIPKHLEAEKEIEKIEAMFAGKDAPKLQGGEWLLGFARYRRGELMLKRVALQVRSRTHLGNAESIRILKQANTVFDAVLKAPDGSESGEGTSLHASALLRVIQIRSSLFDAYAAVKDRECQAHRVEAEKALDLLKRRYPEAQLPNGEGVVHAAEQKVRQLVR